MKQNRLFEQFPPVSTDEWLGKINADLKGADFNKKMVWRSAEGFDVQPFYRKEDLLKLNHVNCLGKLLLNDDKKLKKIDKSWLVRQDIQVEDYDAANLKALEILMQGVDSIGFIIKDAGSINEKNFSVLLRNIVPEGTEINFKSEGKAREIVEYLKNTGEERNINLSAYRGAIEADPLSRLMLNGTLCVTPGEGFDYLAALTTGTRSLPGLRNIQVNGSNFRNAGTGVVQELGLSLSMGLEYLSQLTDRGIGPDEVAARIRFSFATGAEYFMEIAKLRAARILWSLIADAYGFSESPKFRMEIHSVTSTWNTTIYDPYVNMLRSQTEAMSAVLGGTDSLTVNPFDIAFNKPGNFSERIARNQQLILKEEACFDHVSDPASGSYYVETLTALVAEHAWKLFLEIEENGGFYSALKSGIIQQKIKNSANEARDAFSRRKEILLGTNLYPDQYEKSVIVNGSGKDKVRDTEELIVEPVKLSRLSEDFEKIREAVNRLQVKPVVFLLQMGDQVMSRIRAQFSSGFFGCAGYTVIGNDGSNEISAGVEDAVKSGADIIVICSSDEEYSEYGPAVLSAAGNRAMVVIAGNPPDMESLIAKGLTHFISMRSDLGVSLKYYNNCLGINN